MKISKKNQLLTLLLATFTFSACANPNANNKQAVTENSANQQTQAKQTIKAASPLHAELNKAKTDGKAIFVVVTGTGATDINKAMSIAKNAIAISKNATVIQMNRDLPVNEDLVSEWRLSGAPLPLILVISPKGYTTGGYTLADATADKIAALVPSPKMDEVYAAINNKKPSILVISKKSNIDKAGIILNCKSAANQLKNNVSIIEIDSTDPKEAAFIKQLNLKSGLNKTSVLVLNSSGQTTGSFTGKVEVAEIVGAATKVIKSCGTSCSPGGC
jgi:Mrp family chromosome partitioning ATPase